MNANELILDTINAMRTEMRDGSSQLVENSTRIGHILETVDALDKRVRTGNGGPSLSSEVQSIKAELSHLTTVKVEKVRFKKEMTVSLIAAIAAVSAAVIALYR